MEASLTIQGDVLIEAFRMGHIPYTITRAGFNPAGNSYAVVALGKEYIVADNKVLRVDEALVVDGVWKGRHAKK